jgi:hypothetical protein
MMKVETSMYLDVLVYDEQTDQIQVPLTLWEQWAGPDDTPTFVRVDGNPVGRIVPADIQGCRIPTWLWELAGGPVEFVELERVVLPTAGSITLKPRGECASLEEMTAALGVWSCLSVGAELALSCGVYDIIAIQAADGTDVPAACILDCDVNLEIAAETPPLEEAPPLEELLPLEEIDFSQMIPLPQTGAFTGKGHRLG